MSQFRLTKAFRFLFEYHGVSWRGIACWSPHKPPVRWAHLVKLMGMGRASSVSNTSVIIRKTSTQQTLVPHVVCRFPPPS